MTKEYAYIRTKPQIVKMSLPYNDGSEKMLVICQPHKLDLTIKQGNESIIVEVSDIDWLRQALDDVKSFHEMQIEE